MQKSIFFATTMAFVGFMFNATEAEALVVDCSLTNVTNTLEANPGVTEITVNGSCTDEAIVVTVDDFHMSPGVFGSSITGCILIDGAQRARIEDLTVTGCAGDSGIRFYNAATGYLFNVVSSNHLYSGIELRYDSFAEIRNSQFLNNGECGVILLRGAVGHGVDNIITDNTVGGLCPIQHSTYTSERAIISDIAGGPAIDMANNSYIDIRGIDATGDVNVALQSQLRIRRFGGTQSNVKGNFGVSSLSLLNILDATEVTGDINVSDISILRIGDTVTIEGKVECERKTSIC